MGNCQNSQKSTQDIQTQQSQSHLINHWHQLPSNQKRRTFQQQLNKTNLNQVIQIYKRSSYSACTQKNTISSTQSNSLKSIQEYQALPNNMVIPQSYLIQHKAQLDSIGLQSIKNGEVAILIMSGSQNPQLNLDIPIGLYDIGLDSACTIFQIIISKLKRLCMYSKTQQNQKIKLYIMTNSQNKNQIKSYFKNKNYFQYGSNNVFFFSQDVQPTVDQYGKIVLKNQSSIYMSPRGNGMVYSEIKDKNLLQHMANYGIKYVYFGPVNNLLLKLADPCSLGYLIRQKLQAVATCFLSNQDCFGYFGINSNKCIKVFQKTSTHLDKKWANTGSCFMSIQFLKQIVNNTIFLQNIQQNYHDIIKQATVFNTSFNTKVTQKCLFFQCFYHQAFTLAKNILVLQINPDNQMAPIKKNGQGKYTFNDAKDKLRNYHKKMMKETGIQLIGQGHVQIHPVLTYQGQNIKQLLQNKQLKNKLKLPVFIF